MISKIQISGIATYKANNTVVPKAINFIYGGNGADDKGRVQLSDIVAFFRNFYETRRAEGLPVEKKNSIFYKGGYTDKEAERNILSNPFKRFEDMDMLRHTKTLGVIEVDHSVWKHLCDAEHQEILTICDEKLEQYFQKMKRD